jgi:hypothetical protein
MSDTFTIHVIREARNFIANPASWTQFDLARTMDNQSCKPWEPQAAKFCAFGALLKAAYDACGKFDLAWHFANSATVLILMGRDAAAQTPENLFEINDNLGRNAILELFDEAIAAR